MFQVKDAVIPVGSWILVTGTNGYIASHVADKLLQLGYNVRGSVRNLEKSHWIQDLFNQRYGDNRFELVLVEDATRKGAFEESVKGVSAVAHVATILGSPGSPVEFISSVVDMNCNVLETAAKETSVKRFVYTSSSESAVYTSVDQPGESPVTSRSWNELAITRAQGVSSPSRGFDVYAASKTRGLQTIWTWIREHKPGFVANTVLPSLCFGGSIDPQNQGHPSSSGWPVAIFQNHIDPIMPILNSIVPRGAYCVDVQDVAALHVAGLLHPNVESERIFAFGAPFHWADIVTGFSKLFPERDFPTNMTGRGEQEKVLNIESAERSAGLLKEMGWSGWTLLEDTLKANIADLV